MPPNLKKTCTLCGSCKHTLATCTLRGAAVFRQLLQQQRQNVKSRGSRVCRGSGEAHARKVKRKPGKKKVLKNPGARNAVARRAYSGDSLNKQLRKEKTCRPDPAWTQGEEAVATLTALGFLSCPDRCPTCGVGQLLGPVKRHDVQCADSWFYRCSQWDCKQFFNVLKLQGWLLDMKRFTTLSPTSLLGIIYAYVAKTAPRPGHAHPLESRSHIIACLC